MAIEYLISPLLEENAQKIITWRYDPPYDLYDLSGSDLPGLLNPDFHYHQVLDSNRELIGYCCFGPDAQVPGGEYLQNWPEVIDVGIGLRPDLTGQGFGTTFVGKILEFGLDTYQPERFRATIASFNQRSIKTFEKLCFIIKGSFIRDLIRIEFYQLEKIN